MGSRTIPSGKTRIRISLLWKTTRRGHHCGHNGRTSSEVRTFGKNGDGWHNLLIFGDNQQVLKRLLEMKNEEKLVNADGTAGVRLIYIDPPFGTGDEYGSNNGETAYSAKKQGANFIEFLRKRLVLLRDLLSSDGSIYVRLDYHFAHYMKAIMDEVLD